MKNALPIVSVGFVHIAFYFARYCFVRPQFRMRTYRSRLHIKGFRALRTLNRTPYFHCNICIDLL